MAAVTFAVENGGFSWRNGKQVFSGINFSISSGELAAVLGPNGVGKTTLLRSCMGFLKWTEGRSTLDGVDTASFPERELRRRMAYVPQARGTPLSYTVLEMTLLGRGGHIGFLSQPGKKDYEAAAQVLDELGLTPLRDRRCDELSGGEWQMVLIARALAAQPQVLILDEPESNLDMRRQLLVMDTLRRLADGGMACLFNTHYPAHALRHADKSLLLYGGGQGICGDTREVITQERIAQAFGVHAVVGELDSPAGRMRDVIPVELLDENGTGKPSVKGDMGI